MSFLRPIDASLTYVSPLRRSNKLSLSNQNGDSTEPRNDSSSRAFSNKRHEGGNSSHGGRSNPFSNIAPLATTGISSPTARPGASSAFGLGSGAFGFGSATRPTPKTPGSAFDSHPPGASAPVSAAPVEKKDKPKTPAASSKGPWAPSSTEELVPAPTQDLDAPWPLQHGWVIWYRPPTSKNSDYEKSIRPMCNMSTAQEFWKVFVHLKRPSMLPVVSDYHLFKEGIRPVWEDESNKRGGKWIIRLKKGVADRYWESLQMAMIGNQFAEAADEVCGAVISMRSGEDVISIWTKNDGGRNIKIRYVDQLITKEQLES